MKKQTWPALKSCKHQQHNEAEGSDNDQLSKLPHEILMLIMSLFTTKEAAQTSVLSRRWNFFWQCFPILIFKDDHPRRPWAARDQRLLPQGRSDFTGLVNSVIESHLGLYIDELKLIFDLDVSYQSSIDKWLAFALAKHVKNLELDFTPQVGRKLLMTNCYTWPLVSNMSSLGSHSNNLVSLTSLCLKYVNVSDKDIECILLSCYALENLCVVGSIGLKNINLPQTPLQLKHLELSCCKYLSYVDIRAPKLVSFTSHGQPIAVHYGDSSSLSEVSIGNGNYSGEVVAYAYRFLAQYLSNLEYLSWHLLLTDVYPVQWNRGISKPLTMSNLKHLELHVQARGDESLLGWADLIEESPALQKLTLKFSRHPYCSKVRKRNILKRKGRPLKNLNTLEHFGFLGLPIDIEFATYVVENCVNLKQVVFTHPRVIPKFSPIKKYAAHRVLAFKNSLPQEVAFKFGEPAKHCCPISTLPFF